MPRTKRIGAKHSKISSISTNLLNKRKPPLHHDNLVNAHQHEMILSANNPTLIRFISDNFPLDH